MSKKKKSGSRPSAKQQNAREQMRAERAKQQAAEQRNARLFKIGIGVVVALIVVAVVAVVQWQRSQISAAGEEGVPYPRTVAEGYVVPKSRTEALKNASAEERKNLKGMWEGVGTGDSDAPVVVELFEDFSCEHCGAFEAAGAADVLDPYIKKGQVRTVYYPVTLQSFTQAGFGNDLAAKAYAYAADQGKGEEFAEAVFAEQANVEAQWDESTLVQIGDEVGLDSGELKASMKSSRFDQYLESIDQTMTDRSLTGTPGVIVNGGKEVQGSGATLVEAMKAKIIKELDRKDNS